MGKLSLAGPVSAAWIAQRTPQTARLGGLQSGKGIPITADSQKLLLKNCGTAFA